LDDQASYQRARKRVRQLRGFYVHLTVYLLVNTFLLIINLLTSPGTLWFYWPLLGWGIGIVAHAASVFGTGKFLGKEWEEQKIKELMSKGGPK